MVRPLKGATAADTHSAILDLIRSSGVVSRIELADRSGLTEASISRIIKQLLADGVIAETGFGDRTGGRRRILLQLNPGSRHAVGVSLDVAKITYLLTDLSGAVVGRLDSAGIGHQEPTEVTGRIAAELEQMITSTDIDRGTLMGMGMAVPGRKDSAHQVVRSNPEATDWDLSDIEETLSTTTNLPVMVENDSTCAAMGEYWVGRIPASEDFATVYLASGFGLGFVTKGDVYRGSSSNAGEIGHMILDVNGPLCWCGSHGCLEALAAPKRIVERALERRGLAAELGLLGKSTSVRQDAAVIAAAAAAGQEQSLPLIEESASYVAKALVSMTNLLDLDQIILAGPGFGPAGEIYVRWARQELQRLSFVRAVHATRVGLSASGELSAALGAAALVLHSRLTPHQRSARLAVAV